MGSFKIKKVMDSPAFAVKNNFGSIPRSRLTYTRYKDQTLVYCNNPEGMTPTFLKDQGRVMNKATITTKEFLVYVSSVSTCGYGIKLAVLAKNNSASTVNVTQLNHGFNASTNWNVAVSAYKQFFKSMEYTTTILPGKTKIIKEELVPAQNKFEALMKFETDGKVDIEVFAYRYNIASGSEPANLVLSEYSGTAEAFYISTNNTIKASNLFVSYYNSIFYAIGNKRDSGNPTEHNPIRLVQGGIASEDNAKGHYDNLGNFGLQYAFSTTLHNDTSSPVTFKGYIISNPNSHCAGIQSGGIAEGLLIGPNGEKGYTDVRWNFCEVSVNPYSSTTVDFQYMPLSKGNTPCIM